MEIEALQDKKILIVGFGLEGNATLAYLTHFFPGQTIAITDEKDGPNYLANQENYDFAVRSPGVRKDLITIPYTTATNIFFANVKGMTIGITGSKGKSTTASLIYSILKAVGRKVHLVGNIGNPMLAELLETNEQDDILVCELSSFQLDDINYSPHISVILNLFPEHMDYHGDIKSYYDAKVKIIAKAKKDDFLVYNPTFGELVKLAKSVNINALPFVDKLPLKDQDIPLIGLHNKENVNAAATVAKILDVPDETIALAIGNFKSLPHRLENVGTYKGITFYDDAIATIPESTISAIESLGNIGTILLGGKDRGYDFSRLVDTIIDKNIPNIVFFPESGKTILKLFKKKIADLPNYIETTSMEEAVKFAHRNTPNGSICLLSCASPSFSLWKNFEEKGNEFQKFVRKYGE